jgi:hypothetical protein
VTPERTAASDDLEVGLDLDLVALNAAPLTIMAT